MAAPSQLATMAAAAFRLAWRALGQPSLKIIAPLTAWRLPAGYSYQPGEDAVTDAAGRPVTDLSAFWMTTPTEAVPARASTRAFDPTLGGYVATGNVAYDVPWDMRAALTAAWGVQDEQERVWRVVRVSSELEGAPVTVELEAR